MSCVALNDGQLLRLVLVQAISERLYVIVGAARTLTPLHDALDEGLFLDNKVKDACKKNGIAHNFVPSQVVVLIAGKAVDEELSCAPTVLLHRLLDQATRDGHWHYLALIDDLLDQLAVLGPTGSLRAKQVTR